MMILSVWLFKLKKPFWMTAIPAVCLLVLTVWSLSILMKPDWSGAIALLLMILAFLLVFEAFKSISSGSNR